MMSRLGLGIQGSDPGHSQDVAEGVTLKIFERMEATALFLEMKTGRLSD